LPFSCSAHHPEKKIIKKIVDRRPKKHRISDIERSNQNLGKCISKVNASMPDFQLAKGL